jgi:rhodanese-related sulfurtransferase
VNQFREKPLPLRYETKQQRMETAVAQIAATGASHEPASSAGKMGTKPGELTGVDQARYQAYLDALKKRPADAYNEVLIVWKWNDSADLQRSVISNAAKKVSSSEESEALELMLKALDDPGAQWQECERLGRGNSLEKLIASKRIAILESNPRIKAAKPTTSAVTPVASAAHPQNINWQAFRALAESKKAVILDARTEKIYRLGHVPGALNLPREGFASEYAKQKSALESQKDQPIAVYCAGLDCEDSKMVSDALIKLGYRRVLIFKGGWTEWTFQKLPQEVKR